MMSKYFLLALILLAGQTIAQTAGNLDIFYRLADSSITLAAGQRPGTEKPEISLVLPSQASILEQHISENISKKMPALPTEQISLASVTRFVYTLRKCSLRYPELFRDGFLGPYRFTREILYEGSLSFTKNGVVSREDFSYTYSDTLNLDEKSLVELAGFPITEQKLPSEPVFISILEPVTAIAALGVTAYLLFTVRKSN